MAVIQLRFFSYPDTRAFADENLRSGLISILYEFQIVEEKRKGDKNVRLKTYTDYLADHPTSPRVVVKQ